MIKHQVQLSCLYIFHYHLLPGGVTTVIRDGVFALLKNKKFLPKTLEKIVIVSSGSNKKAIEKTILPEDSLASEKIKITVELLKPIAYRHTPSSVQEQKQLSNMMLERYGDGLWWVHNYHLGKNTCFTGACLYSAYRGQRMILQIHDFPECGRPENNKIILNQLKIPFYPTVNNVHYIVINPRDYKALETAKINSDQISLVPNPILNKEKVFHLEIDKMKSVGSYLKKILPQGNESLLKSRPLWLYPVRARRRKNLLEAGLLAKLNGSNLIITLKAQSQKEKPYSDLVEKLFRDGIIFGAFGIGGELENHNLTIQDLIKTANVIISTSIEEGFGFQFLNAIQHQKPIITHDLDVLTQFKQKFRDYPAIIYNEVCCSLESKERKELLNNYYKVLRNIRSSITKTKEEELRNSLYTIISGEKIDFSFLSIPLQKKILYRCNDKIFLNDMSNLNSTFKASQPSFETNLHGDKDKVYDFFLNIKNLRLLMYN